MGLHFTKMQGLGNDFVVIDGVSQPVALAPEHIRRFANRHFGVGCDQVLLVESFRPGRRRFSLPDLQRRWWGSRQCGNGARCFARFVRDRG